MMDFQGIGIGDKKKQNRQKKYYLKSKNYEGAFQ